MSCATAARIVRPAAPTFPPKSWRPPRTAEVFARWLDAAEEKIGAGIDYCSALTNWRIRFATALPALIGARTIALLRAADSKEEKIKVPRKQVRRILLAGLLAAASPVALRALFQRLLAP